MNKMEYLVFFLGLLFIAAIANAMKKDGFKSQDKYAAEYVSTEISNKYSKENIFNLIQTARKNSGNTVTGYIDDNGEFHMDISEYDDQSST